MAVDMHDGERAVSMLGVPGRLLSRMSGSPGFAAGVWVNQKWISESRPAHDYGAGAKIQAEVRLDDNCKNGHSTFAITADIYAVSKSGWRVDIAGGCCHADIAKAFPELAPLIRWHLTSTDGPMHYIANTVYHAGDRDHYGLRVGESRQIVNGQTGKLAWVLDAIEAGEAKPAYALTKYFDGDASELPDAPRLWWAPMLRIGEGKARDLAAARSTAIWSDATDEELCAEPAALRAALDRRALLVANNHAHIADAKWAETQAKLDQADFGLHQLEQARSAAVHRADCDAARLADAERERDEALHMAAAEETRALSVGRSLAVAGARADRLARVAVRQRRAAMFAGASREVEVMRSELALSRAETRQALRKLAKLREGVGATSEAAAKLERLAA